MIPIRHFRSLFLSDVHLATIGCKADHLIDFMRFHESETLYLVGDIVDGWRIKKKWFWLQAHNDVIQKLLRKARKGARVVYIAGNHDEALRDFVGLQFGGVNLADEVIHTTADGRRMLVTHGDRYDGIVRHQRFLALLGADAYDMALRANHYLNRLRRRMGLSYWSLSAFLEERVKRSFEIHANFRQAAIDEARRRGFDGVICGHTHRPGAQVIDGLTYANPGDWVEHCTALAENHDGTLEIIPWPEILHEAEESAAPGEIEEEAWA